MIRDLEPIFGHDLDDKGRLRKGQTLLKLVEHLAQHKHTLVQRHVWLPVFVKHGRCHVPTVALSRVIHLFDKEEKVLEINQSQFEQESSSTR